MFFIKLKKKKEIKEFLANILSYICTSQKTNPTKVATTSPTLICYVLVSYLELNCTFGNITCLRPIIKFTNIKHLLIDLKSTKNSKIITEITNVLTRKSSNRILNV